MNKWIGIGRLTNDPDVRYGENGKCIARYSLAIDRKWANAEGKREADFINCVAFDKSGEFAEKYLHKGMKMAVVGRIQTGSYTNRDGNKVYTTDIVIEEQEFVESKQNSEQNPHKPVYENQKGFYGGQNSQGNNYRGNAPKADYGDSEAFKRQPGAADGFMSIPDDVEQEGLPWN